MKCSTNIFPQPLNILTKRHTATHSPPTLELLQPTLWPGGVMRGNETSTPVLLFFRRQRRKHAITRYRTQRLQQRR